METTILCLLSGTMLLILVSLEDSYNASQYYIRHERGKFYLWNLSMFILLIAFVVNARYLFNWLVQNLA